MGLAITGVAWDDFRLVKAVADRGGLTRAAEDLGINHSTAFRRLAAIEAQTGTRLFERHRGGYVATPAGIAMIEAAGRMEAQVARFQRESAGRSLEPAGELRITAPAGLVANTLMPLLGRFAERYPLICLDLVVSEEALNLSRRDADVAIRASDEPPATLVGRRLATIQWAVYGRSDRIWPPLSECVWVCPSEAVAGGRFTRFLAGRATSGRLGMRINTVLGLREAIEAGIGVGPLPCWDADASPTLVRLSETVPELTAGLWLLTHPDLRHAGRVRAFMDFMAEAFVGLRPAIEGLSRPR
ncbi:LysR family transcriptional regulator [Methylobacterium sp. Leaf399]|uniref:LysR family transcriptional regulator n=1 Tax=Methylobacterium sp. Leaf399 TaxID=1736364 RepID=UPI0006FD5F33|nr:LysR family transcriptional regulator [Methylobacterium sp. Leaf399]KQT13780.1 LysR family transcriptional regulator [Methylobacterium sp. Leaf399]